MTFQPSVEIADPSVFAMLTATSVYMVDGEKIQFFFPTTSAAAISVVGQHLLLEQLYFPFSLSSNLICMKRAEG
jgi:hypothetical protein